MQETQRFCSFFRFLLLLGWKAQRTKDFRLRVGFPVAQQFENLHRFRVAQLDENLRFHVEFAEFALRDESFGFEFLESLVESFASSRTHTRFGIASNERVIEQRLGVNVLDLARFAAAAEKVT